MSFRTHSCGQLRIDNVGNNVILSGWVQKTRRMGQIVFVDLRDKKGITQIVFAADSPFAEQANALRSEYVIKVTGKVIERKSKNPNIPTGDIEIIANKLEVLSEANTTPLIIADETDALEEVRMKYRYLDLRRNPVRENIELRHHVVSSIRDFFNKNEFIDVETPMLTRATPEGARNYIVPSRINQGKFYALPQSPQLFKQLLMIGGFERYYQITKCFRDEDLRSDRQPEFTQLDVEASFLTKEEFQTLIEKMLQKLMKEVKGIKIKIPIDRISYQDAMSLYGSDKPDTRFDLKLSETKDYFAKSEFSIFKNADSVQMIVFDKVITKKEISELEYFAKEHRAKGLGWVIYKNNELTSPIVKFAEIEIKQIISDKKIKNDSTILFVADEKEIAQTALGAVRTAIGKKFELYSRDQYKFAWIDNWPLFEKTDEGGWTSSHHPFTSPVEKHKTTFDTDPQGAIAQAYDIVLNGYEIGGGSVRIFSQDIQTRIFKILGMSEEEIKKQFGFFISAFQYGTPPHCGIAFGIDRIAMLLSKDASSIKDVIAFPKNSSGICTMTESPGEITEEELNELGIKRR